MFEILLHGNTSKWAATLCNRMESAQGQRIQPGRSPRWKARFALLHARDIRWGYWWFTNFTLLVWYVFLKQMLFVNLVRKFELFRHLILFLNTYTSLFFTFQILLTTSPSYVHRTSMLWKRRVRIRASEGVTPSRSVRSCRLWPNLESPCPQTHRQQLNCTRGCKINCKTWMLFVSWAHQTTVTFKHKGSPTGQGNFPDGNNELFLLYNIIIITVKHSFVHERQLIGTPLSYHQM